jgi:exodeoxyribonuclease VII large subunit
LGLRVTELQTLGLARVVWSVAGLLQAVGDAIQSRLPGCTVEGEVSGLSRPASGHLYFSLKDGNGEAALLRCAMFRRAAVGLDFALQDGQRVQLRGRLGVYEPRGELQMVVEAIQRAGAGNLYEQFLRLKAKLEAAGLFDPARKRPLPAMPKTVAVVTSLGAAALRDVCTTLARRSPQVQVVVVPSLVQGAEAPASLVAAIGTASAWPGVDALIVCRGGGSIEDLWAFNDEAVVRAVAGCAVPVVCGVGHETDITLCDLAADLRAPTPTAAAELVAPALQDLLDDLSVHARRLVQACGRQRDRSAQRLDQIALRLGRPASSVAAQHRRIDALRARLQQALGTRVSQAGVATDRVALRLVGAARRALAAQQQGVAMAASRLQLLDPSRVLDRGYAWLLDADHRAVASVRNVAVGDAMQARVRDGTLALTVAGCRPDGPDLPRDA